MSEPTDKHDDLPVHAKERLADMRKRRLFTSDLSVSEFVLVREAGFDPVGMVMGVSIYQIAPKIPSLGRDQPGCELVATTKALYHARELAMNRMEEEAEELGADGIIGVRLTVNLSTDPNRVAWQQYRAWSKWSKGLGFRRPQGHPGRLLGRLVGARRDAVGAIHDADGLAAGAVATVATPDGAGELSARHEHRGVHRDRDGGFAIAPASTIATRRANRSSPTSVGRTSGC